MAADRESRTRERPLQSSRQTRNSASQQRSYMSGSLPPPLNRQQYNNNYSANNTMGGHGIYEDPMNAYIEHPVSVSSAPDQFHHHNNNMMLRDGNMYDGVPSFSSQQQQHYPQQLGMRGGVGGSLYNATQQSSYLRGSVPELSALSRNNNPDYMMGAAGELGYRDRMLAHQHHVLGQHHTGSLPRSYLSSGGGFGAGAAGQYGMNRSQQLGSNFGGGLGGNAAWNGGMSTLQSSAVGNALGGYSMLNSTSGNIGAISGMLGGTTAGVGPQQLVDLQRIIMQQRTELEAARQKLQSSMNSIKTFWSPELKKERAMRKEEHSKLVLVTEQMKIASMENQKNASLVKQLEEELRRCSTRDNRLAVTLHQENELLRGEKERMRQEVMEAREKVRQNAQRFETVRQLIETRDNTIKMLTEMLNSKQLPTDAKTMLRRLEMELAKEQDRTRQMLMMNEDNMISNNNAQNVRMQHLEEKLRNREREIAVLKEEIANQQELFRQQQQQQGPLQNAYDQYPTREQDMNAARGSTYKSLLDAKDDRINHLEREIRMLENDFSSRQRDGLDYGRGGDRQHMGGMTADFETMELNRALDLGTDKINKQIDFFRDELQKKEAEARILRTKYESSCQQTADHHKHLLLLQDTINSKDEQISSLSSELENDRKRLDEKNKELELKTHQLSILSSDKQKLEMEMVELNEQAEIRDRKLNVMQRKVETLDDLQQEKETQLESLRAKMLAVTSELTSANAAVKQAEQSVREAEKQNQRQKDAAERVESDLQNTIASLTRELRDVKNRNEAIIKELEERQQQQLDKLQRRNNELSRNAASKADQCQLLEQQLHEHRRQQQELRAQLLKTQEQQQALRSQQQSNTTSTRSASPLGHHQQDALLSLSKSSAVDSELRQRIASLEQQCEYYKKERITIQNEADRQRARALQLDEALSIAQAEAERAKLRFSHLEATYSETQSKHINTVRKELQDAHQRIFQLEDEALRVRMEAERCKSKVLMLEQKVQWQNEEKLSLEQIIEQKNQALQERLQQSTAAEQQLSEINHKDVAAASKVETDRLRTELERWKSRATTLEQQQESMHTEMSTIRSKLIAAEQQLAHRRQEAQKITMDLGTSHKSMADMESQYSALQTEHMRVRGEVERLQEQARLFELERKTLQDAANMAWQENEECKIQLKVTEEQCLHANSELEQLTDELERRRKENNQLDEQLRRLAAEQTTVHTTISSNTLELQQAQQRAADLERQLKAARDELNARAKENEQLSARAAREIEEKVGGTRKELELTRQRSAAYEQELKLCQQEISKLNAELKNLQSELTKRLQAPPTAAPPPQQPQISEEEVKRFQQEITALNSALEKLTDERNKALMECSNLQQRVAGAHEQLQRIAQERDQLRQHGDDRQKQLLGQFENEATRLMQERDAVARECEAVRKICGQQDEQLNALKSERETFQAELARLNNAMNDMQQNEQQSVQTAALQQRIQELTTQLAACQRDHAQLREELQRERAKSEETARTFQQNLEAEIVRIQNEFAQQAKQKDERIMQLENALKESVSITEERESAYGHHQQQVQASDQKVKEMQRRLNDMQLSYEQACDDLHRLSELMDKKDAELRRLSDEKRSQFEEMLKLRQEALVAQLSAKDAEMASFADQAGKNPRVDDMMRANRTSRAQIMQQFEELAERIAQVEKEKRANQGGGGANPNGVRQQQQPQQQQQRNQQPQQMQKMR